MSRNKGSVKLPPLNYSVRVMSRAPEQHADLCSMSHAFDANSSSRRNVSTQGVKHTALTCNFAPGPELAKPRVSPRRCSLTFVQSTCCMSASASRASVARFAPFLVLVVAFRRPRPRASQSLLRSEGTPLGSKLPVPCCLDLEEATRQRVSQSAEEVHGKCPASS